MHPDVVLGDLGFPALVPITGRHSIADLHQPRARCGIYVLHFDNGEWYAGQAVDVVRRYTQHRKTHTDIRAMTFQQVPQPDPNQIERQVIHTLERDGRTMRNISHMSVVTGERDLDLVVTPEEQEAWLAGQTLTDTAEHVHDAGLRQRYHRRFETFLTQPYAEEATALLSAYLTTAIPAARHTELSFWVVSCLPNGGRQVRYRVSLNMMEVFTLLVEDQGPMATFHLARSPLEEADEDWPEVVDQLGYPWSLDERHHYAPGGQDQVYIEAHSPQATLDAIGDEVLGRAMRVMNLRLMRKGATFYSKYHCLDLVDHALAYVWPSSKLEE